jgi:hypothetical protein
MKFMKLEESARHPFLHFQIIEICLELGIWNLEFLRP